VVLRLVVLRGDSAVELMMVVVRILRVRMLLMLLLLGVDRERGRGRTRVRRRVRIGGVVKGHAGSVVKVVSVVSEHS
jgi:hypothetical protein